MITLKNKFIKPLFSNFILISLFLFTYFNLQAQNNNDSLANWQKGGFFSVNINQLSLTNWARGGESSYSTTGLLNYFFNYKNDEIKWDNTIDLGYGLINNEDSGIRKNEDKIDYISTLGYRVVEKKDFYYSALLNFKTQFDKGYNYPNDSLVISNLFAPAFLIVGIGMEYKYENIISVNVSPLTGRLIFITDKNIANTGLYGNLIEIRDSSGIIVQEAETLVLNFGFQITTQFRYEILENVNLISRLDLFNNYTDRRIENRKNIDINSETTIVMKINKFLAANIFLQFIYDDDTKVPIYESINGLKTKVGDGRRLQIKQVLGIGLSFQL